MHILDLFRYYLNNQIIRKGINGSNTNVFVIKWKKRSVLTMIKRKWARACISLIIAGILSSFILPSFVSLISESQILMVMSVIISLALVIAGGIIKLVFCKCPNCGSLAASNYVTWSVNEKEFHCPKCGKRLVYDDDDERKKRDIKNGEHD